MLKFIFFADIWQQIYNDFKTSYVEVYPIIDTLVIELEDISKHLMLKFIDDQSKNTGGISNFKTSYVEVYHRNSKQ